MIEEDRLISQDHLIATTFNEYLISIPNKNMPKNQEYEGSDSSEDPVSSNIEKYQNHSSNKLIKSKSKSKTFKFRETDEIKKLIEKLDPKKASQKFDMSTNIL